MMSTKVLVVDDDANVLSAYKRELCRRFHVHTEPGGQEGLRALKRRGPFAVVVSDLRMPGMDGIHFLHEAMERAPDTVRMMLTGNADLQAAMDSVNDGNIFRFHTKPCPLPVLARSIEEGIKQHRHQTGLASKNERLMVERTQINERLQAALAETRFISRARSEFLLIGLALLSSESETARRLLERLRARYPRLSHRIEVAEERARRWWLRLSWRGGGDR